MATRPLLTLFTYNEYLELEERTGLRHEFVYGIPHAMAGGTRRYSLIGQRIARQLYDTADMADCEVHNGDTKFRLEHDLVYYPDVLVTCSREETDPLAVHHPCLVVEVLSPSTRGTDLREKMIAYRNIPSIVTYLVVEQDEPRVIRHWRESPDAGWRTELYVEGTVPVGCLPVELELASIYANLPPADPAEA